MITVLTVTFLLIITLASVVYINNRRSVNRGKADTWEKLMMSRLNK
ncbi:MAG: hypothetical protein ACOCWH_01860 [Spirochaetota bacterium]